MDATGFYLLTNSAVNVLNSQLSSMLTPKSKHRKSDAQHKKQLLNDVSVTKTANVINVTEDNEQTPNQIRENTRNQVAKQFNERIKNLQVLLKSKDAEIRQLRDLYNKTAAELSELKAKHDMQEEWIERMQDFCNMSDADRKEFIEQQRAKHRLDKNVNAVMSMFDKVFV